MIRLTPIQNSQYKVVGGVEPLTSRVSDCYPSTNHSSYNLITKVQKRDNNKSLATKKFSWTLGVEPNPQSYCLAFRSDSQALSTKTNKKAPESAYIAWNRDG